MSERWFRHADPRYPFASELASQPPARWHGPGEGPVQYLADTPAGAWAEYLRHEAITDADDLDDVRRALWVLDVDDGERGGAAAPSLSEEVLTGGIASWIACQEEARRLRSGGARALRAPSAALLPGGAAARVTRGGLRPGRPKDGWVLALFGPRPDLEGRKIVDGGRLDADLLRWTRPL